MPIDNTPRSAYAHWNEEQDIVWYQEVGRFSGDEDPPDPDEFYEDYDPNWEENEEEHD